MVMEFTTAKEIEQGGRMRAALERRGFVRVAEDESDWQERWEYREDGSLVAGVVLSRVANIHDPVEAEIWTPRWRPVPEFAYNAKGMIEVIDERIDFRTPCPECGNRDDNSFGGEHGEAFGLCGRCGHRWTPEVSDAGD